MSSRLLETSIIRSACALALGCAVSSAASAAHCPAYDLVDLGALPGAEVSWGNAINNQGLVVGGSYTGDTWSSLQHGFVHDGQQMRDLGPANANSIANAVNTQGQVAGAVSEDSDTRAVIWDRGRIIDLGHLGAPWAEARDINDRGEAVGYSWLADYSGLHAFIYAGGRMRDLGTLGGTYSYAEAVNRWGEVVGGSTLTPEGYETHAFVYRDGRMQTLGSFGCTNHYSFATDINDRGEIVGVSQNDCGDFVQQRAFLHRNGQIVDIGDLGGGDTRALAINNFTQIVGFSLTADYNAAYFLWERGVMRDLRNLLDPQSPWVLENVNDINDRGEIAGQAYLPSEDGELIAHAVLLKPRAVCR